MKLRDYIIRRLLLAIPTIIGLTLITFVVSHIVPADPAILYLGEHATPEMIQQYRDDMGLNDPLYIQYLRFLGDFFRGDFGKSLVTRHPVIQDILTYLPATLELSLASMTVSIILGIIFGIICAVKKDSVIDYITRTFSLIGVSMPVYWTALIAMGILYSRLGLVSPGRLSKNVVPPTHITGMYILDSLLTGNLVTFIDSFNHIILPALILGGWMMAGLVRQTRASMIDALNQDYIRTARSKGLKENKVVYRHALRNALIPTVTLIGMSFGGMLSGAVVTETVFYWPGLGSYMLRMTMQVDFAAVVGGVAILGLCYTLANLITDIVYGLIDPRIRYG